MFIIAYLQGNPKQITEGCFRIFSAREQKRHFMSILLRKTEKHRASSAFVVHVGLLWSGHLYTAAYRETRTDAGVYMQRIELTSISIRQRSATYSGRPLPNERTLDSHSATRQTHLCLHPVLFSRNDSLYRVRKRWKIAHRDIDHRTVVWRPFPKNHAYIMRTYLWLTRVPGLDFAADNVRLSLFIQPQQTIIKF